MKKIIFTIMLLLIPFFVFAEECNSDKVSIKSIELIDYTNGVCQYVDPEIDGDIIELSLGMEYLNDSAEYRLILENKSNEDFSLNKNLSNPSEYIEYNIEPADGSYVINKNSEKEFILTVKYANEVPASSFDGDYYEEEKETIIDISEYIKDETGDKDNNKKDPIVNPKTGNTIIIVVLVTITVLSVFLFIITCNESFKKTFLVIFLFLLIPLAIKALCYKEIKISSYVEIRKSYSGMLMERNIDNSNYLSTNILSKNIKKIIFTNSLGNHTVNGTDCFDVSIDEDGTVLAWVSNTDNNGYVTLTIGADKKVFASSGYALFSRLYNLESIEGLEHFDTSYVNNMSYMFSGCLKLVSLDLSHFNTSNVTDMSYMFNMRLGSEQVNSDLQLLILSSFNTSNVQNMEYMFASCTSLISLDLSGFNTSFVTTMESMFSECHSLGDIRMNNFNTSNVINMSWMFNECHSLSDLDLSNFNTSNVRDMYRMFSGCYGLRNINLSGFNTSSVTNMGGMFMGCSQLTSLNLKSFNTSKVNTMYYMFMACQNLVTIEVTDSFVMSQVSASVQMFEGCTSLVGGEGTTYNSSNPKDKTYARIDGGTSSPGYFTRYEA